MIVIAFSALTLRIILEKLIQINIAQNESNAQTVLRLISTALENYSRDNQGVYPKSLSVLTQSKSPYIKEDITGTPQRGYSFDCARLQPSGYSCSATPTSCRLSGKKIYKVSTGSFLESEECDKKESGE
jgi:type II secretory pathway pseudopilin PulG